MAHLELHGVSIALGRRGVVRDVSARVDRVDRALDLARPVAIRRHPPACRAIALEGRAVEVEPGLTVTPVPGAPFFLAIRPGPKQRAARWGRG